MSPRSHGDGSFAPGDFASLGKGVVFEAGVLVFHADRIEIGDDVYVGHQAILKGYYKGRLAIGSGTWIGQQTFLHAAGDITIGKRVGIGPAVRILTSAHRLDGTGPILDREIEFAPVVVDDGADIGTGAILLPGCRVGSGAQIGAGAVVASDIPPLAVAAGVPAKVMRFRS